MTDGYATNSAIRKELSKPFDPSQIVKVNKGFGPIDTMNHAIVTDRLNSVVPAWTMSEPQLLNGKGSDGGVFVLCSMTIDGITRWEVGEGSDYKKALSDWIKRAAMRFGVGLDLWAKAELESASAGHAERGADAASSGVSRGAPGGTVQREQDSLDGRAAGGPEEKTIAYGEGAALQTSGPSSLASNDQWSLLVAACMTEKQAVNRLNKANKAAYTNIEQARRLATQEQLDNALAEV